MASGAVLAAAFTVPISAISDDLAALMALLVGVSGSAAAVLALILSKAILRRLPVSRKKSPFDLSQERNKGALGHRVVV